MFVIRYYLIVVSALIINFFLVGQVSKIESNSIKQSLPVCFLIGEYEQAYDNLLEQYSTTLVTVCNNDNDKAFAIWSGILSDLENFAKVSEIDLNGVKLWMNVFFNNTGGIEYIVYYPKPNSKNMDFEKLTNFFSNFCKTFKNKEILTEKCMLNASASFPIFTKRQ